MAAAGYSSVRRSSISSSSSSGSEYGEGARRKQDTKHAVSSVSSSHQPFMTPSPLNFLSLAEPTFTPLSMDSDLFPDRDNQNKTTTTATSWDSPSPEKQQATKSQQVAAGLESSSDSATTAMRPQRNDEKEQDVSEARDRMDNNRKIDAEARNEGGEGEGDGATIDQDDRDAISRMNPRQRYAGSTPLSLDPLQVARGGSAATDTTDNNTHPTSSSVSPPPRPNSRTTTSPPIQPVAPLALRTKNITDHHGNINSNNSYTSSSITSPAASACSPSTVLSAPAAFTRQLSTSSLRSNSSLISQIQDSLHQQQQHRHRHHHSSGSNATGHIIKPIVRTTSDSNAFTLKHPIPDLNCRSGAYVGNVAALEKSAERLSMTSSIEDAIRDLHGELKRSDSRRSSILAANVAASQSPVEEPPSAQPGPLRVIPPVASIVELNNAARLGGYSPSGYVMSPNHSLTGRLRSGSKNSASGRPEIDVDAIMLRHGPGKGSTRSARSAKPSLAEIAETEPVALTQRALDEADRAPVADDDATIRRPNTHYETSYNGMIGGHLDETSSGLGLDFGGGGSGDDHGRRHSEDRPGTPRSTATFDHKNAFDDFDGVHCQPDQYDDRGGYDDREQSDMEYHDMHLPPAMPKTMPMPDIPEPQMEPQPRAPRPPRNNVRPQSYFDELTGQEMLYYPARVPAMLNLPPKLSKKPKTVVRNARHSKVLQAMGHPGFGKAEYLPQDPEAPAVRESKMWLPDPLAGHGMSTFGEDVDGQRSAAASIKGPAADSHIDSQVPAEQNDGLLSGGEPADMPQPPPPTQQRRKSKLPRGADLPPQLRASAFFDLPSTTPQIQIKDGSAMATLDSILDASANAPVSAFTDHAFAGKLGTEVYGPDKKTRRKSTAGALLPEEHIAASQKKKGILPFGKKSNDGSRQNSLSANHEETRALSDNVDGGSRKSGDNSDDDKEEEEEDEFAHVLDGPPTTLLAELQLRKYQAKMRTQMPNSSIPGGMHSTLLELDAVAEAQKRHRERKKIALAWEDNANDEKEGSDDDEVPLGVLYANQGLVAQINRPIGLLEKRELEENEPLSSRRARLTGQEPPKTLRPQRSAMTLNAGLSQLNLHRMPSAERVMPQEESDDDEAVEGETLGERMRRLRAKDEADHNNLPKARPVSRAFSAEILTQFGDVEEKKDEDKGKAPEVPPEEETLGQRRKRLQAEREAREREMTLGGGPVEAEAPQIRKKHSLADVLATHPIRENPAVDDQRRRFEEERKVRAQDAKMAAVRAQMPTSLDGPKTQRTGGYKNGQFNDGTGGTGGMGTGGLIDNVPSSNAGLGVNMGPGVSMGPGGWNRSSIAFSNYGAPMQQQPPQQSGYGGLIGQAGVTQMAHNPTMGGGYAGYAGGGMGGMPMNMNNMSNMNLQMNPYGGGMGMPMQMQPMGMSMGMQQGMAPQMQHMQMQMQPGHGGQQQTIERWRQSIMQ